MRQYEGTDFKLHILRNHLLALLRNAKRAGQKEGLETVP
ncbi:MAG: hypothetical protein CEO19_475 [Parcubacteria group bacterium Gr01-1014_73]|nr:MAG: hypothetical protein CEO19_475 [Parcubacteria group bacterium Gr01-1014_73]